MQEMPMSVDYAYGNRDTEEFIDLGKSRVFYDMFYDLVHKNIDSSDIDSYLRENLVLFMDSPESREEYISYISRNIKAFVDYSGDALLLKASDICADLNGKHYDSGDLNFYFYNGSYKKIWDMCVVSKQDMKDIEL